jgi:hypothetical protein
MNEKSAEAAFVQPRHTRKATKNDPLLADSSEQVSDPALLSIPSLSTRWFNAGEPELVATYVSA